MRLPQISPPPTEVEPSREFNAILDKARKIQKQNGDSYLGVDTLLLALLDNKDIKEALQEAGMLATLARLPCF